MRRSLLTAVLSAALAIGWAMPAFAQPPDLEAVCLAAAEIAEGASGQELTDCDYFEE